MRASDIEALPPQNTMATSTSNVANILPEGVYTPTSGDSASEAPPSYEEAATRVTETAKLSADGEENLPPPYSLYKTKYLRLSLSNEVSKGS